MPSEKEKRLIAYALHRLQIGESHAAIEARLATDSALPRLSPTEIRDAVTTAAIYAQRASMLRRSMQPELPGVPTPSGPIGAFAGPGGVSKQYVGLTVYFEGTLRNGRRVQGSTVVNVWSEADIGAVRRAVTEDIVTGKIPFPGGGYAFRSSRAGAPHIEISVSTITPYSRRQGIKISTSGR